MDRREEIKFLDEMEAVLEGSPYSCPERSGEVLDQIASLSKKRHEVRKRWDLLGAALEDADALKVLQERWRFPFTHHSNRLEFEGPSDERATERIAKRYKIQIAQDPRKAIALIEGLDDDDRVVAGHDAAFQYALELASSDEPFITEPDT